MPRRVMVTYEFEVDTVHDRTYAEQLARLFTTSTLDKLQSKLVKAKAVKRVLATVEPKPKASK